MGDSISATDIGYVGQVGAHSGAANVGVQPNAFLREAGQVFREPRPSNAGWRTLQGKNRLEDENDLGWRLPRGSPAQGGREGRR